MSTIILTCDDFVRAGYWDTEKCCPLCHGRYGLGGPGSDKEHIAEALTPYLPLLPPGDGGSLTGQPILIRAIVCCEVMKAKLPRKAWAEAARSKRKMRGLKIYTSCLRGWALKELGITKVHERGKDLDQALLKCPCCGGLVWGFERLRGRECIAPVPGSCVFITPSNSQCPKCLRMVEERDWKIIDRFEEGNYGTWQDNGIVRGDWVADHRRDRHGYDR